MRRLKAVFGIWIVWVGVVVTVYAPEHTHPDTWERYTHWSYWPQQQNYYYRQVGKTRHPMVRQQLDCTATTDLVRRDLA